MKQLLIFLGLVFFFTNISHAILPAPPKIDDVKTQQYMQSLYDNHNVLTITTTLPNGSRNGASGEVVIFNNSGTLTFWVNRGGTSWTQM